MRTDNLTQENPVFNGVQKVYQFPNGYGASVARHQYSYGHEEGLWEVAVLWKGLLCYDSGLTTDVFGHQTEEQVDAILQQIEALK